MIKLSFMAIAEDIEAILEDAANPPHLHIERASLPERIRAGGPRDSESESPKHSHFSMSPSHFRIASSSSEKKLIRMVGCGVKEREDEERDERREGQG